MLKQIEGSHAVAEANVAAATEAYDTVRREREELTHAAPD